MIFYSCFKYDKDDNLWLETFSLSSDREFSGSAVANDNQWFLSGGYGDNESLDSVEQWTRTYANLT